MTPTKYLWSHAEGDQMFGLFDTPEAAEAAARKRMTEDKHTEPQEVYIFDARPALATDADLFEGLDENEGGCDTSLPDWWKDKWVPHDVVRELVFTPGAATTSP